VNACLLLGACRAFPAGLGAGGAFIDPVRGLMQTNTHKRRVKWLDDPATYEVKRAYAERDKRQERIGRARKAQKRKTRQ